MTEHTHQPCPFCDSTDAFSYNSESGMFKCYSCDATPSNKKGKCRDGQTLEPFTFEDYEEGISLEPYVPDKYRGITKHTMEKCGVYFTKQGDKETVHYTYPNATKHRELPKSIKNSGSMDAFWGQDDYNGGGRNITITEGEEDRMSVIQMMGDYPTVSLPNASPSKAFWANAKEFLSGFEKIILSVDNDGPGDKVAEAIYRMFPGKVYRVAHTKFKDANDFLKAGEYKSFKDAWWNAQKLKPKDLFCTTEDFLRLYEESPDYEYFETGIQELDEKMLGIHKSAFTMVLAPTGIGKTEFFRYLEHKILKDTGYTLATCHGEETRVRSLLGIVSYDLNTNVTRQDLIQEGGYDQQVRESIERITKDERLYQFSIRSDDTVDDIIEQVRFLGTAMGVDYVFIEPIQDYISASDTSNKESLLTDLANKLKLLAAELNIGIVVIAHSNKEGEAKYAASLSQSAAYEIRLHRDQETEDPIEGNRTYVSVGRKNRTGGGSGPAGYLDFDIESYTLTPKDSDPAFDNTTIAKTVNEDIPF